MGEQHLAQVNSRHLTLKLQQRQQPLEEHGSLLKARIAVVEDLAEEGVEADICAHVASE